jgi:cyanate permease
MIKIAIWIAVIVILVAIGPLLTIWSLNTLFGLSIAYTFWTWLAVVFLGMFFNARIGQKSS